MTRAEMLRRAIARLAAAGVAEPARDARLLGRWAAGMEAAGYAARLDEAPEPAEAVRFTAAAEERSARRPVAQIIGRRLFWGRAFRVTAETIDPRPETECLIAAALERPAARVLDLGTGTGCILLTLLAEWEQAEGLGTDLSAPALAVAEENAAALGLAARARFQLADWGEGVAGRFDLVVSNPPYLAEDEIAGLEPELRLHEPRAALTPGGDGLDAYRRVAEALPRLLAPGGRALLEIGPSQGEAVPAIMAAAGLPCEGVRPDLDGRPRVVMLRAPAA